jgi:hypothetical protein
VGSPEENGFCGEAYAAADRAHGRADLDLKLTMASRGPG